MVLSNYYSYEFGQRQNSDFFSKHGQVKGRIDLLLELEKELGYKVYSNKKGEFTILSIYAIKDINYYIIEKNGVKTIAIHEY